MRRWKVLAAALVLGVVPAGVAGSAQKGSCGPPRHVWWKGRLPHGFGEVSGVAASWRHPGVAWMIRDSGKPASLYALRIRDGKPHVREIRIEGAHNKDWEDLTYAFGEDRRPRLLIVESTQSGRAPYIYEVFEPDPDGPGEVKLHRRYRYRYPHRGLQNTEASFVYDNDLVLVTKSAPARLYRFEALRTGKINRPAFVGRLQGGDRLSIARPSSDRAVLVASDHEMMTVYRGSGPSRGPRQFTAKDPAHRKTVAAGDNIEAGDFFPYGSCNVLLISEKRNIYRLGPG